LFQTPVQSAHSFDILFPNGEQKLDVSSLAHGFAKRSGKFTWSIEARFIGTRYRTEDPGTDSRHSLSSAPPAHTDLFTIIKRKSKRVAKGGESTLGCVRFSAFKRKFMGLPWGRSFGFAAA
jgi:hypothetical protein